MAPRGQSQPRMEAQEGPIWSLNTPEAGLGGIFLVGGYLLEVNSPVGFARMLMRPRLYKCQLVSFCSLCSEPPPVSGQASQCRKRGNETGRRLLPDRWLPSCFCPWVTFVATTHHPLERTMSSKAFPLPLSGEACLHPQGLPSGPFSGRPFLTCRMPCIGAGASSVPGESREVDPSLPIRLTLEALVTLFPLFKASVSPQPWGSQELFSF